MFYVTLCVYNHLSWYPYVLLLQFSQVALVDTHWLLCLQLHHLAFFLTKGCSFIIPLEGMPGVAHANVNMKHE